MVRMRDFASSTIWRKPFLSFISSSPRLGAPVPAAGAAAPHLERQFEPSSRGARACGRLGRPSPRKSTSVYPPGVGAHNVTEVPMVTAGDDFRKEDGRKSLASPWFLWLLKWPGPCL